MTINFVNLLLPNHTRIKDDPFEQLPCMSHGYDTRTSQQHCHAMTKSFCCSCTPIHTFCLVTSPFPYSYSLSRASWYSSPLELFPSATRKNSFLWWNFSPEELFPEQNKLLLFMPTCKELKDTHHFRRIFHSLPWMVGSSLHDSFQSQFARALRMIHRCWMAWAHF